MKVVLFCGGLGLRLREYSEWVPKPMVPIGYRSILWHLMKYYAYYGHKDFILCLGYKGDVIRRYFLEYNEYLANDCVLSEGGRRIEVFNKDGEETQDWNITFVDTGIDSNIGQRLKAVEGYLRSEEVFLANYADVLTDLPLPLLISHFLSRGKIAIFICVKPVHSFHIASVKDDGAVSSIQHIAQSGILINGGFFVFRKEIFNYIHEGEELVEEPFQRLIAENELIAYKYDGFWACMDTLKDKQRLDDMYAEGNAPWEVWREKSNVEVKI